MHVCYRHLAACGAQFKILNRDLQAVEGASITVFFPPGKAVNFSAPGEPPQPLPALAVYAASKQQGPESFTIALPSLPPLITTTVITSIQVSRRPRALTLRSPVFID